MSKRSHNWRRRNKLLPAQVEPPKSAVEARIMMLTHVFNRLVPKCARGVHRDRDHIVYCHPTRGWKFIHIRRFGGAEVLLPAAT